MHVQTIVYTADMGRGVEWYSGFLGRDPEYASDMWTTFAVGDARLALHHAEELPEQSRVAVSLVITEALEAFVARVGELGIEPVESIRDQPFGRSVLFRDREGLPIQVNRYG